MSRPLVGTALESKKNVHDLILFEWEERYNRHAILLTEGTYEVGEVIADADIAPEGEIANDAIAGPAFTDALCLENVTVPAGESWSVKALTNGPAVVNFDEVTRASGAETDAQLLTRLADLITQGIRFVREPMVSTETDTFA